MLAELRPPWQRRENNERLTSAASTESKKTMAVFADIMLAAIAAEARE